MGELLSMSAQEKFHQIKADLGKLSGVGFEPTPTFVDQNAPSYEGKNALESGALDHSAILTCSRKDNSDI